MDWTLITVALIAATPPTGMAWLAWSKARAVKDGVQSLRIEVNHRLDELIAAAGAAGEARGRATAHREQAELDQA